MKEEFEDITFYNKDSELLKKYANNNKNDFEKNKEKVLNELILNFYRKVFNNKIENISLDNFTFDFYGYGYNMSDGYYIVYDGNFRCYKVIAFKDNINSVFIKIIEDIIKRKSYDNIYNNKNKICDEYKKRFSNSNELWQIYEAEYAIDIFDKYYDGNIPEDIIDRCLNRIFIENAIISYDKDNKQIIIDRKIKRRKLIK